MIYESINPAVMRQVPASTRRLLDLGCGSGVFGERVRAEHPGCTVTGITFSADEQALAAPRLDTVLIRDLDVFDPGELEESFDCIVCSHVLEHLLDPARLVRSLRQRLNGAEDSTLIVALPNVLLWKQRLQFIRGRFRYTEGGLMDSTHRTFFDWNTARQLLEGNGWKVEHAEADGAFPLPGVRGLLGQQRAEAIDRTMLRRFPGLFGFQFVFTCRAAALGNGR